MNGKTWEVRAMRRKRSGAWVAVDAAAWNACRISEKELAAAATSALPKI